jgi:hypothetical protein
MRAGLTHRFLSATCLSAVVVSAAVGWWGCGQNGGEAEGSFSVDTDGGNGDDGFGSGGGNAPPIQGLTSISVTPATTALTLQYPVSPPGATTQLKAEGKFQDGHSADVTTSVAWTISPNDIASVGAGAFASTAPGTFTVTAVAGTITSNPATVTVTLTGSVVGMGVTQGDLDGTPSGGAPTIAYPLDGALFPYQLGPIEFQVVATSPAQTEARIAFEGSTRSTSRSTSRAFPIAAPAIPNACAVTVPSDHRGRCSTARAKGTKLTETVRLAAPGWGLARRERADRREVVELPAHRRPLLLERRHRPPATRSSCGTTSTRPGPRPSSTSPRPRLDGMGRPTSRIIDPPAVHRQHPRASAATRSRSTEPRSASPSAAVQPVALRA